MSFARWDFKWFWCSLFVIPCGAALESLDEPCYSACDFKNIMLHHLFCSCVWGLSNHSDSDSMISLINGNGVVVNVQLVLVQNQQSSIASSLLNSSLFGWCGPISDSRLQAFQPFLDSWQKPKIFQKGWNPAVRVLWKKSRRIHVVPACNSLEMSMRTRVGIILPRFFLKWCSSRPRTVIIYVHCTNVCMGGIWITSSARARPTQQTMMIEWIGWIWVVSYHINVLWLLHYLSNFASTQTGRASGVSEWSPTPSCISYERGWGGHVHKMLLHQAWELPQHEAKRAAEVFAEEPTSSEEAAWLTKHCQTCRLQLSS